MTVDLEREPAAARSAPPASHALADAYERCRALTKGRATNFYYAFASLPKPKRRAIYAVYAFAGTVDDSVDQAGSPEERRRALAGAQTILDASYARTGDDWLAIALGDAVARYQIPPEYFRELVAGMEQDLRQSRYQTFAELEQYCYRAASVIGVICIHIFGFDADHRREAIAAATDMGKALQLTNILRDVREDAERDRIYLAQEDLTRFGYSEADLHAGLYTDAFRSLMAAYTERTRAFYRSGERLLPLLDGPRSRMCCNGLQGVYRHILDTIEARDFDVYGERISPSKVGRLALLLRLWLRGALPIWDRSTP